MTKRVFVYYNLHRHLWSIRDCKTRRVIDHALYVELEDVTLKVSEAGRQRVLKERRKNVHAGVEGTLIDSGDVCTVPQYPYPLVRQVTYNPYKYESFVFTDTLSYAGVGKTAWMLADGKPQVFLLSHGA